MMECVVGCVQDMVEGRSEMPWSFQHSTGTNDKKVDGSLPILLATMLSMCTAYN